MVRCGAVWCGATLCVFFVTVPSIHVPHLSFQAPFKISSLLPVPATLTFPLPSTAAALAPGYQRLCVATPDGVAAWSPEGLSTGTAPAPGGGERILCSSDHFTWFTVMDVPLPSPSPSPSPGASDSPLPVSGAAAFFSRPGSVALLVIGAVVLLCLCLVCLALYHRHRRRIRKEHLTLKQASLGLSPPQAHKRWSLGPPPLNPDPVAAEGKAEGGIRDHKDLPGYVTPRKPEGDKPTFSWMRLVNVCPSARLPRPPPPPPPPSLSSLGRKNSCSLSACHLIGCSRLHIRMQRTQGECRL